jgi:splicing suppressor protein 51
MEIESAGRLRSPSNYTLLTPILALKQGSCFSCWKVVSQLKRCTACKRVSYCSQECQKKDWGDGHKKTCKVLVASNKLRTATSPTGRTWPIFFEEKVYTGFDPLWSI